MKSKKNIPHWQWVKETPVAILEENELPAWKDAKQLVNAVKKMGAKLLRYPAIRWGVHSFGKSSYLPKYPGLDKRDLFGEIISEMCANNIKVMAYVHYGVLHTHVKQFHENWMARKADGSLEIWNGNHFKACLCNDDFIESMRKAIYELISGYSPDALYLDGPTWYCNECFCDSCKNKYLEMFNEEMPDVLSFEDGSKEKYNIMRDRVIAKIVKDLRESLSEWPQLPLLFNTLMGYNMSHRCGRCELTCENADGGNTTEVHRPGSFWDMYENVKLGEALEKVSMCYLPPGPYETLRTFDALEVKVLGSAYLMHGATPMLGTVSSFLNDDKGAPAMKSFNSFSRKHKNVYYESDQAKETALIFPRAGAEYSAKDKPEKIKDYFTGAFRLLLHSHIHFNTFYDTQISAEKLKQYRAVWMPGGVCVTEKNAEALREYVSNGGSLFATGPFSMMNEKGKKLDNFLLADLLGADFIQEQLEDHYRTREYRETGPVHDYSLIPEAYLKISDGKLFKKDSLIPVSDGVVGVDNLQRFIEYSVVKARGKAKVMADLFLPSGGAFGAELDFPLGTPPGIIFNQFGKGKVIYSAAPFEKNYLRRGLPELRELTRKIFNILLDNKPLVKMDAPAGVIMNMTRRKDKLYLHLLNYCGTIQNDRYYIDWIAPLKSFPVSIYGRAGKIKRISDGAPIEFKNKGGYIEFETGELKIFETFEISGAI